jgi:hypothetical protein
MAIVNKIEYSVRVQILFARESWKNIATSDLTVPIAPWSVSLSSVRTIVAISQLVRNAKHHSVIMPVAAPGRTIKLAVLTHQKAGLWPFPLGGRKGVQHVFRSILLEFEHCAATESLAIYAASFFCRAIKIARCIKD